MTRPSIPAHLTGGVERWIEHGIWPGSFLSAVIRNDLRLAVMKGDGVSRANLACIVAWFYEHAPSACWGFSEKADAWHEGHKAVRAAAKALVDAEKGDAQ